MPAGGEPERMTLRTRLVAAIALALALSLLLGGALAAWHARRSVRAEVQTALVVATHTVRNDTAGLAQADDAHAELLRLVAAFDGNRHVVATLQDASGRPVAVSRLAVSSDPPPHWLARLIRPALAAVVTDVPAGRVVLEGDSTNEIGEVWASERDTALVLVMFCGMACVLAQLSLGRALRPLRALAGGFQRLGGGELSTRVQPAGAPELQRLARGFNDMAERLSVVEAHNRRLHQQLLSLQEQERAELARDLHDEVGPFLFAASMDAASIQLLAATGRPNDVAAQARAIEEAIGHAQKHVRMILGRLRHTHPAAIDLAAAIAELLRIWRRQHPGIDLAADLTLPAEQVGEAVREAVYRVAQEGLNNAVRHGRPRMVRLVATQSSDGMIVVQVHDDGQGGRGGGEPGFELIGLRERLARLDGTLTVESGWANGGGWILTATLPMTPAILSSTRGDADEAVAGR